MAWKSRCGEWSRPPEPSPDASGMLVQLLRAATECEFDLVPEPGQVMQRARTSDAKSSNSPPAQGALHAPIHQFSFWVFGMRRCGLARVGEIEALLSRAGAVEA